MRPGSDLRVVLGEHKLIEFTVDLVERIQAIPTRFFFETIQIELIVWVFSDNRSELSAGQRQQAMPGD